VSDLFNKTNALYKLFYSRWLEAKLSLKISFTILGNIRYNFHTPY